MLIVVPAAVVSGSAKRAWGLDRPASPGAFYRKDDFTPIERRTPELLKSHAGQYAAIHDEHVVDSDTNERALVERVLKRVGNVSIHVGQATPTA